MTGWLRRLLRWRWPEAESVSERDEAVPDSEEPRFCPEPFRKLLVAADKNAYLCCWLRTSVGDLREVTSEEAWNGDVAHELRASILDGSFRYCSRELCPFLQGKTLPRRSEVTEPWLREVISQNQTRLDRGFVELMVGYDRSCNLACPSCRPDFHWAKGSELDELWKVHEHVVGEDLSRLHGLEMLYVSADGDGLASPLYRKLLQSMDSSEFPNLRVRIMTNGIMFTPAMWEKLARIRDRIQEVVVSIDAATETTYRTVRKGGDFSVLLENLEFLARLRRESQLTGFSITFVVQRVNFREMPGFVEMGHRYGCNGVTFMRMMNPGHVPEDAFVHEPSHPDYSEFRMILSSPVFDQRLVNIGAFADIRGHIGSSAGESRPFPQPGR